MLHHAKNSPFHPPEDNQALGSQLSTIPEEPVGLSGFNSFKSMNNIISAYEALNEMDPQNRFEDESFLIGLT